MDKFVIFCKSYINDVDRVKLLKDSIDKFNSDDIKFYVSVPSGDMEIFKNVIGTDGYELISDESIVGENLSENWSKQQIIKSEFWKTELCENYLMIDSDSYFIKEFSLKDFMYNDNTPYTVMHECKDLLQFASRRGMSFVKESFVGDRLFVQDIFGRTGRQYDFGPSPCIWSSKVWRSLKEEYLDSNNLNFSSLINVKPCEFHWYGEWLLKRKPIDIIPIEPIFKVFHYAEQYQESKNIGDTEKSLSDNFLGIVMQSNWGSPFKYE